MAKSKDERWLSVAEAARTQRVSRAAVYKAIAQGRLKSREMVLPRRALRINVEDVKKFRVSKSRQHRGEGRKRRSRQ